MTNSVPVITIDGPSGTGKGTIAQLLAKRLSWNLLDSGALYRVLALAATQHGVDVDNEAAVVVLAAHLDVHFDAHQCGEQPRVILEGEDVTDTIRTETVGNGASKIAACPKVREALLERQRAFCQLPGLVTDGRDMGTVVFPSAGLKIYLQASAEVRAQRRHQQLKEKGINVNLDAVYRDIAERDVRDTQRACAPLKPAPDAVTVDTTHLSIEQVLDCIMQEVQSRFAEQLERV